MTETPRSSRCGRLHQAVYSRSELRSSVWRVGSPTPSRAAPLERDAHRFDRLLVDLLVWALGAAGALAPLADHGLDEGLDHHRVELGAAVGPQLAQRGLGRKGRAVGPALGHRLVGVGDGDDLGREGDLVGAQALRVAGAVEALVVAEHDRPAAL